MESLVGIYNKLLSGFGEQHWWPVTSDNKRFEVIIGAILTQNTAWTNVEKAIKNLRDSGLIDVEKIKRVDTKGLAERIRSSGYHNQKAERLKLMAGFLLKNDLSGMGLEEMRERLLGVKGIGPETADSIVLYAFGKASFVVDAYTERVFSRMGLIEKKQGYEEVKQFFEDGLPRDVNVYKEYHALVVELGKNICKKKPLCGKCPLEKDCEKSI